jgi:isopentenyl phosphate kinase
MKKAVLSVVLIMSVLLVMSCKTTKGTGTTAVNDDTFRRIYDRYWGDLILDGAQKYTVKSGDRLVDISRSLYSNPYYYPVIMLASKDVVVDQDKIQPGMELTIPDLQRNLDNARAKASIKGVIVDCAKVEDDRGRADTARGLREHGNSL